MGLAITVGMLDELMDNGAEHLSSETCREEFALLSRALAEEGVTWREPEPAGPEVTGRPEAVDRFAGRIAYSDLSLLRRVLVLAAWGEPVTPAPEPGSRQDELDQSRIDDQTSMFSSHLLCHSDNAGYYIPVDFDDPLFLADRSVAGAGMVGSSQQLLAELVGFAPAIGVRRGPDGSVGEDEPARAADAPSDPFGRETYAWHQLYRACLASIAGGRAIVFH
ncbi:hypothetical protein [Kitasatospora sp. NPDC050543]|uniref:hypothetical protein n=1 Tax=Kitasatospora sp. NPDC050543 TaxID=3364054 RepID=UPI0037BC1FAF